MIRLGISTKVFGWLLLVLAIIAASFWFSMDQFSDFRQRFTQISQQEIPDLIAAAELEMETNRLVSLIQDILLVKGEYQLRNIEDLIQAAADNAAKLASRFDQRPGRLERTAGISVRFRLLADSLLELLKLKRQEVEIEEEQQRVYRRVSKLSLEINTALTFPTPIDSPDRDIPLSWHILTDRALSHLFAIRDAAHPKQVMEHQGRFRQEITEAESLIERMNDEDADNIRRIHQEIISYGIEEPNLFERTADLLRLRWRIEEHIFDQKGLLDLLLQGSQQLHDAVRQSALAEDALVGQEFERFRAILPALAAISVLSLIALHVFVRRSVIRRIIHLQGELKANTERDQPMPIYLNGNDELNMMAREFNFFIEQIRHREADLQDAADKADRANRAKDDFIANISHEIRTPMNSIINLTSLCLQGRLEPNQRGRLEKVERSSDYLMVLINEILDFARIESQRLELELAPFRLQELIGALDAHVDEAERKGLFFRHHIDIDVSPVLRGDSLRIQQVLRNLTANAIKFTNHGGIEVQIRRSIHDEPGQRIEFSVKDTGIGIDADKQQRIFEAFNQADSSTTRRFGGSGLGLTICRRLVELMGGEIGVRSHPGDGSHFFFTLPLESATEAEDPTAKGRSEAAYPPEKLVPLRNRLVLLVEDNEFNQAVAMELLEKAELQVDLAKDGCEALELVREEPYELILMDIQMPEMDGFEATREIRRLPGRGSLPIIALTANAMTETREECLQAGMNDLIAKPIVPTELYEALLQWIDGESAPDATSFPRKIAQPFEGRDDLRAWNHPKLLRLFLSNHRDAAEKIRRAMAEKHTKAATLAAHNLKAAAATFEFTRLSETAAEVEHGLKTSPGTEIPETLLARLGDECRVAMERVEEQLGALEQRAEIENSP